MTNEEIKEMIEAADIDLVKQPDPERRPYLWEIMGRPSHDGSRTIHGELSGFGCEHNARLIAAAPTLARELIEARETLDTLKEYINHGIGGDLTTMKTQYVGLLTELIEARERVEGLERLVKKCSVLTSLVHEAGARYGTVKASVSPAQAVVVVVPADQRFDVISELDETLEGAAKAALDRLLASRPVAAPDIDSSGTYAAETAAAVEAERTRVAAICRDEASSYPAGVSQYEDGRNSACARICHRVENPDAPAPPACRDAMPVEDIRAATTGAGEEPDGL